MSQMREYASNVLAQGLGRVASLVANLAAFVLIARFMGPEVFGRYSYLLTFLQVAATIADFGTNAALARDIARAGDRAPAYWGTFLVLRALLTLVVMGVAAGASFLLEPDLGVYLLVGALALPVVASRFFEPVFQVYERPWYSMYASLVYGASYLGLAGLCLLFARSLAPVFAAYLVANAIYTFTAFGLALSRLRPRLGLRRETALGILRLAAPVGVSTVFAAVHARAAIFVLGALAGDREVGLYNAAYRFLDMAALLAVVMMNPAIPLFSRQAAEDRGALRETYARIMETLGVLTLPVAIGLPLLSPLLITGLYGDAFREAIPVLNLFGWVGMLIFGSLFGVALCVSIGVVHFGYWNTALAATLSLGLNWLLIPRLGVVGSAWAALLCEIQLLGVTFVYIVWSLGNVFRPGPWLRIAGLNAALWVFLAWSGPRLGALALAPAAVLYAALLAPLGLVPRDLLARIRASREEGGADAAGPEPPE